MRTGRVVRTVVVLAMLAAGLEGCAFLQAALGEPPDLPLHGAGDTVKVFPRYPGEDPRFTAERYCAQRGRRAYQRDASASWAVFDCLPE